MFYIRKCSEWSNYAKYGITENPYNRIANSSTEHAENCEYIALFRYRKRVCEYFGPHAVDDIISKYARDPRFLLPQLTMRYIDCEMPKLAQISRYLVDLSGGREFIYNGGISALIDIILTEFPRLGIEIEELTEYEIVQINKTLHNPGIELQNTIVPRPHQLDVLDKYKTLAVENNIMKLIWSCGLGKTLLSLFIVLDNRYARVLIGVPSIFLQEQFCKVVALVFPGKKTVCVGGDNCDVGNILKADFVITTYQSCKKITSDFDFKIGDEAHHLCEGDEFCKFLEIRATKTLYMTATEKCGFVKHSMAGDEFGVVLDKKDVKWAIDNGMIADYNVIVCKNTLSEMITLSREFGQDISGNISYTDNDTTHSIAKVDLFMSAYMAFKSMEQYGLSHIIIFSNSVNCAELIYNYLTVIKAGLVDYESVYVDAIHSNTTDSIGLRCATPKLFEASKRAIVSCVYKMGEGYDFCKISGIVFAGEMKSQIRIHQCSLRGSRKDHENPEKCSYIIIPCVSEDLCANSRVTDIFRALHHFDRDLFKRVKLGTIAQTSGEGMVGAMCPFNIDPCGLEKIQLMCVRGDLFRNMFAAEELEYQIERGTMRMRGIKSRKQYMSMVRAIDPSAYYAKLGVWRNCYDLLSIDTSEFLPFDEWKKDCIKRGITDVNYDEFWPADKKLPPMAEEWYFMNEGNLNDWISIDSRREY